MKRAPVKRAPAKRVAVKRIDGAAPAPRDRASKPESAALVAVGANLGDRRAAIAASIEMLQATPGITVDRVSSLIETAPVGGPPQGAFLNGALVLTTTLTPSDLLGILHSVEAALGRVRRVRNGPRTIDLDLLFYESERIVAPGLEVPHPRMLERPFVLQPAAEIAPDWIHPETKRSIQHHWLRLQADSGAGEAVDVTAVQELTEEEDG